MDTNNTYTNLINFNQSNDDQSFLTWYNSNMSDGAITVDGAKMKVKPQFIANPKYLRREYGNKPNETF